MYTSFTDWDQGEHLSHHGIKGQKWGVRRFQNSDGTLTAEGRKHYGAGDSGSKRMARQFNRQMRKLNRLQRYADTNQQRANIEKYDSRAKKAIKVGNTAAGIAAGTLAGSRGLGALSKKFDDGISSAWFHANEARKAERASYMDNQDFLDDLRKNGGISESYYNRKSGDAMEQHLRNMRAIDNDETNRRVTSAQNRNIADFARNVTRGIGYAAAGTAAVSYGVAAYSKIQSRMAKTRLSEVGHAKAVANARAQVQKMEKMFANTPYSELIKKQNKKIRT